MLTIRPAFPVRVIVNRNLVLEPCRDEATKSKLILSAVIDDKPVQLTAVLPAAAYCDLVAYAEIFGGKPRFLAGKWTEVNCPANWSLPC